MVSAAIVIVVVLVVDIVVVIIIVIMIVTGRVVRAVVHVFAQIVFGGEFDLVLEVAGRPRCGWDCVGVSERRKSEASHACNRDRSQPCGPAVL